MIVSIHQPNYIPWLGYFYKIFKSDVFVILDDVQYTKNSYINRNRIKTPQGVLYLTIPVEYKGHFGSNINEITVKDELGWREKHLKTIEMNYKKNRFFSDFFNIIRAALMERTDKLSEINTAVIKAICGVFDLDTEIVSSSSLNITSTGTGRLIDICRALGADCYLSGKGGSKYQDEELFRNANINLSYTDFKPEPYSQLWGDFAEGLSAIDYIFNCGYSIKELWKSQI